MHRFSDNSIQLIIFEKVLVAYILSSAMLQHNSSTYLYNPYLKPYVAFLDKSSQPNSVDGDEKTVSYKNLDVITDVHIEGQLNEPISTLTILISFSLFLIPSVIFIQMRTLTMLKSENTINSRMMATQAKLHMVFWPSCIILFALTDIIYPLSAFLSPHFCTLINMYMCFGVISIILYSLYAALLRYMYLVQDEMVKEFGKTQTIRLMYWMFYIHTFFWSLYCVLATASGGGFHWVSSCYGWKDQIFLHEETKMDVVLSRIRVLDSKNGKLSLDNIQCVLLYYFF